MEDKISLWAEDFTHHLKCDLESLGISAEIYAPHGIIVKFESEDDMNFYKVSGRFKEEYYLMLVGPDFIVDKANLKTILSPSLETAEKLRLINEYGRYKN